MSSLTNCPACKDKLRHFSVPVGLVSASVPERHERLNIAWCNKCSYKTVAFHNHIDNESDVFVHAMIQVRDRLEQIASWTTKRGCAVKGKSWSLNPGMRKLKTAEAKAVAQRNIDQINVAINRFTNYEYRP